MDQGFPSNHTLLALIQRYFILPAFWLLSLALLVLAAVLSVGKEHVLCTVLGVICSPVCTAHNYPQHPLQASGNICVCGQHAEKANKLVSLSCSADASKTESTLLSNFRTEPFLAMCPICKTAHLATYPTILTSWPQDYKKWD